MFGTLISMVMLMFFDLLPAILKIDKFSNSYVTIISHIGIFIAALGLILSLMSVIKGGRHNIRSGALGGTDINNEPLYNSNITQNSNDNSLYLRDQSLSAVSKERNIKTEEKSDNTYQEIIEKRKGPRILKS